MSSSLSEDEFVRLQTQLLELRTANYQHVETISKHERDLLALKEDNDQLAKEVLKANKTISKSKKAKEVEQLLAENESLQRKLSSQEDDFRLQSETLMQELQQLVASNEGLEKERAKWQAQPSSVEQQPEEARRLNAHNAALQKTLTASQERHDTEVHRLRETISDLEAQCLKFSGQRGTPVGEGSESRFIEGQNDDLDSDLGNGAADTQVKEAVNLQEKVDALNKEIDVLRLTAETEKEEKRLLQEQLQSTETSMKEQMSSLKGELEKSKEKLKKKQESLLQLQEEKERLYSDLSGKLENIQLEKNSKIQNLEEQSAKMQSELSSTNHAMAEYENKSQAHITQLEQFIDSLESRVEESSQETVQQLAQANEQLNADICTLKQQINGQLERLNATQATVDELNAAIEGKDRLHSTLLEKLKKVEDSLETMTQKEKEASTVAEKRKALLDELAIKYQEETDEHRNAVRESTSKHEKELEELSCHIDQLQSELSEYNKLKEAHEQLKAELHSTKTANGWLERQLNETEENLKRVKEENEAELNRTLGDKEASIASLQAEHEQELENLNLRIKEVQTEKEDLAQNISQLKQDVKDGVDEKKIHERKGNTILKDLKRQLLSERKRGDKLQERLQELLADTKSRQSVEELFRPNDPNDRYRGDASSLGSWSAQASGISQDFSATSPDEERILSPSGDLQQENVDLIKRIGDLQQEKWTMEEKVVHLESSNAAMADDLLMKTAIIQHYVMESKHDHKTMSPSSDKITLKRVVDFVKDKGDENLREINRKLQRMLEETLTKNMHLQQDMETLSQEIVRLSKINPAPS